MIELVDTHTHLNDAKFDGQEKEVIERARAAGVTRLINMGDTLASSEKAVKLAETYDGVFAGVGIHPEEAIEMTAREDDILAAWTELPGVVAIGEIGLDYYWEEPEHEIQKKWFAAQLDLAKELKLPVIIHSRDAAEDTLNIVREYMQGGMYGGIIHCFSYSKEIAAEYLKMGLYLGIGGVLTFKNAKKLKEVAAIAPLSQIVLETDCPYMAPEPNRGRRNSSLNLPYVAEALAQIKGITAEEVIAVTEENAKRLLFRA